MKTIELQEYVKPTVKKIRNLKHITFSAEHYQVSGSYSVRLERRDDHHTGARA